LKTLLNNQFVQIAIRELWRDASSRFYPEANIREHLDAALQWLALAQDQTGNGGVSAGFGRTGWRPDYPETTGYIIPTFLDYYHLTHQSEYLERAIKMGNYELGVQTAEGAIPGGYAQPRIPCVFDTGQVIFGWIALFNETKNTQYLNAACRAGDWLVAIQGDDGGWHKFDHAGSARSYHSRVAWALVMLGLASHHEAYLRTARRQIDWTLSNQQSNGWFKQAELRGQPFPVTHTIAYTIRGIIESGIALKDEKYIEAARHATDALANAQRGDGSLYGMYDSNWTSTVKWCCLTGCAQTSINWFRLFEITGDNKYLRAARKSNSFVRRTQDLKTPSPVKGAIKGSLPFNGNYERFAYPNWATKFFADALMMERDHQVGHA
jgi:hypothetical protein